MKVNSPCGRLKRRNALAEMQSCQLSSDNSLAFYQLFEKKYLPSYADICLQRLGSQQDVNRTVKNDRRREKEVLAQISAGYTGNPKNDPHRLLSNDGRWVPRSVKTKPDEK